MVTFRHSTLLYNVLSTYNWFGIYENTSVDAAVDNLNAIVQNAMEEEIALG
jgi:hypothetical protein